ncbi:hypothetical protein RSOCI_03845 [Rhabdochlamydiaceae symbiont of Dictyostelium giganteum]
MASNVPDKYRNYDFQLPSIITSEAQADSHLPAGNDGFSSINADPDDSQDISQLHEHMKTKKFVVCKIMTYHQGSTKPNGTAFMISPNLLMTNHHVLRNKEIAQNSYAIFEIFSEDLSVKKSNRMHDYVPLFPEIEEGGYFFSGAPENARESFIYNKENLDYSIVAFKPSVNTTRIAQHFFSLIDSNTTEEQQLKKNMNVAILHFPEIPCGKNMLSGLLKIATGKIIELPNSEIYAKYNLPTEIGSSGSPIFAPNGKLVGIHCRGKIVNNNKNLHLDSFFNGCIPILDVIKHLPKEVKNKITEYSQQNPTPFRKNYYISSQFDYLQIKAEEGDYIERTSHLQELVSLFNKIYCRKNHLRKITIIGGPGMGKKFLATRLALQMASQFSVVLFLQKDNYEDVKEILLERAKVLPATRGNPESEKVAIRSYLREEDLPYLLVLDGRAGYETYDKLKLFLPFQDYNKFILSTSQTLDRHLEDYNNYYIQPFNLNESIQYIKKIIPSLKSENENLSQLLKKLERILSKTEKITQLLKKLNEMHSDDERLIELLDILKKSPEKNKIKQLLEILNEISQDTALNGQSPQDEKLQQLLHELESIPSEDPELFKLFGQLEDIITKNQQLKKTLNKFNGIPLVIKCAAITLKNICENSTEKFLKHLKSNGAKIFNVQGSIIIEKWVDSLNTLKNDAHTFTAYSLSPNIHLLAMDVLYLCAFLKKGSIDDMLVMNSFPKKYPTATDFDYQNAIHILIKYSMISRVENLSNKNSPCFSIPRCVKDIIESLIPPQEKQTYFISAAKALARFLKKSMNLETSSSPLEDSDIYPFQFNEPTNNPPQLEKIINHKEWGNAFDHISTAVNTPREILDLILKEKETQSIIPPTNPIRSWIQFRPKFTPFKIYLTSSENSRM